MAFLALSASFEYLCYRSPGIINILNYVICEIYHIYQCSKIESIFHGEQLVIRGYAGANKKTECLLQSISVL